MSIIDYKNGITKDTNAYGKNVYLDNGQGCGTIWFKDVATARKAKEKDGIKTGGDLVDCSKCACHYSITNPQHDKYPEFLCHKAKESYAKSFEKGAHDDPQI